MPTLKDVFFTKSTVWRCLSIAIVLAVMRGNAAQAGEPSPDIGEHLVRGYITPATAHFQQAAAGMAAALAQFCARDVSAPTAAAPTDKVSTDAGSETLDRHFTALVRAWAGIEFLRFGPLVEDNRFERIYFWPDPRGIMLRQIQALLAQRTASVPDATSLATHSVAVQGLPALEYMLYGNTGLLKADAPARDSFGAECAYAKAIAGNLSNVADDIALAWGQYAADFSHPSPANSVYRSTQELAGEAIKAMSTGLQFARDIKLMPMLGKNPGAASEKKAPFWRSGLFAQAMSASVEGISRFHHAGQWPYEQAEAWIGQSIMDELGRAHAVFAAMPRDLAGVVHQPDGYRQLSLASLLLQNSKNIVDQNMAPSFGARIGFNALDGD